MVECLPNIDEAQCLIPQYHIHQMWCMPVSPKPGEMEAEGSEVECHCGLYSEFESRLDYHETKQARKKRKKEKERKVWFI